LFEGTAIICYTVRNQRVWIDNIFRRGRDFEAVMRDASPDDDEA
jgi:hypothetical protein